MLSSSLSMVMPVRDIRVRAIGEVTIRLTPEFRAISGKKKKGCRGTTALGSRCRPSKGYGERGASGVELTRCRQLRSRSRPDLHN